MLHSFLPAIRPASHTASPFPLFSTVFTGMLEISVHVSRMLYYDLLYFYLGMKEKIVLTDDVLKGIAGNLDACNNCWYHIPTGEVLWAPNRERNFDMDDEIWADVFEEIDEKMDECIPFEWLETHESLRIMQSFAENELADKALRAKLITTLNDRKPFRQFKVVIDNSSYRQAWFDFKEQWYIGHVKNMLDQYNLKNEHEEDDDSG